MEHQSDNRNQVHSCVYTLLDQLCSRRTFRSPGNCEHEALCQSKECIRSAILPTISSNIRALSLRCSFLQSTPKLPILPRDAFGEEKMQRAPLTSYESLAAFQLPPSKKAAQYHCRHQEDRRHHHPYPWSSHSQRRQTSIWSPQRTPHRRQSDQYQSKSKP
jgi:hypothetical protein